MQWRLFLFFQNDCITKKWDFGSARFLDVKRHEKAPNYVVAGTKSAANRAAFIVVVGKNRRVIYA
jgi:hypothetical protein